MKFQAGLDLKGKFQVWQRLRLMGQREKLKKQAKFRTNIRLGRIRQISLRIESSKLSGLRQAKMLMI
jgi:hypothetical protein